MGLRPCGARSYHRPDAGPDVRHALPPDSPAVSAVRLRAASAHCAQNRRCWSTPGSGSVPAYDRAVTTPRVGALVGLLFACSPSSSEMQATTIASEAKATAAVGDSSLVDAGGAIPGDAGIHL